MNKFIFYTNPYSRGLTVRWMLEECGANYETHILNYDGEMKTPEYLKINPMGKVPALIHNGHIITETAAIVTYLADIFPEKKLAPQNRADYYRWLFFIAGAYEPAMMDKMLNVDIKPEMEKSVGYGSLELTVKTLENWLKDRAYIAGDHFTSADCLAAAACFSTLRLAVVKSDILSAYCERQMQRPACKKAAAMDDSLLKEMEK